VSREGGTSDPAGGFGEGGRVAAVTSAPDAVVVGGGIAGLAAARELGRAGLSVLLLEGSPEVGGKLRTGVVGGVEVDVGAESMLARRPEGIGLAGELGLDLVHPASGSTQLWTRGAMRPLPRTLLGVPLDLDQVAEAGVLSDEGVERARHEVVLPVEDGDVSVAHLVGDRLGHEVVDRLVEPLLGGVYAGHADHLSAAATIPQVVSMLRRHGSLSEVAAATPAAPATAGDPVFAGLVGGLGGLPRALVQAGGFEVRTRTAVRQLERTQTGFRLTVGPANDARFVDTARVVVAVPGPPAARLLDDVAPAAADELGGLEYASMAVVTIAVPALEVGDSSGFLVPSVDGRRIKASTYSFSKWGWVGAASDLRLLRASVGRHREEWSLQASDDELVSHVVTDLRTATGQEVAPVDAHVQRWGGGLPQYAVGHLDRVARIRAAVAEVPGLEVCGAAYDGVGIPAVIGSAHRAVASVLAAE
jgi:protoporphyrinogen/coproporphyrinogen III oxidase